MNGGFEGKNPPNYKVSKALHCKLFKKDGTAKPSQRQCNLRIICT